MLNFSSVAAELQLIVAEKMEYFDQHQFQLSSKSGKDIMFSIQSRVYFPIDTLGISHGGVFFHVSPIDDNNHQGVPFKKWCTLRMASELRRFKVSNLVVWEGTYMNYINELREKVHFIQNPVRLKYLGNHPTPEMFEKLSEMFNIDSFYSRFYAPCPDLFSIPKFCEINSVNIPIFTLPDELLLQLKSKEIIFKRTSFSTFSKIDTTATLFFQEWFLKKRSIDWFEISEGGNFPLGMDKLMTSELPISTIWKFKGRQKRQTLSMLNLKFKVTLKEDDFIYSIDRGDKKLLIIVLSGFWKIIGQECNEIEDVIVIEPVRNKRK